MNSILYEAFNYAGKEFLFTELTLAVKFCKSALSVREDSNAARNAEDAERVVQSALMARPQLRLCVCEE